MVRCFVVCVVGKDGGVLGVVVVSYTKTVVLCSQCVMWCEIGDAWRLNIGLGMYWIPTFRIS